MLTNRAALAAVLVTSLANLIVVFEGLKFYWSTFQIRPHKIDVCDGTDYAASVIPIAVVSLFVGLTLSAFALVLSLMNRKKRQGAISLLAVILTFMPLDLGQSINQYVLRHRSSVFTTEKCDGSGSLW